MPEKMVTIKNMDAATWRAIHAEAVKQGLTIPAFVRLLWETYEKQRPRG